MTTTPEKIARRRERQRQRRRVQRLQDRLDLAVIIDEIGFRFEDDERPRPRLVTLNGQVVP